MTASIETCALCPKLCRDVCPVGVATGRERATPTGMAFLVWAADTGRVSDVDAREAASWCVGCGACEAACGVGQPLPELLRAAASRGEPPPVEAPRAVSADASLLAVVCGHPSFAAALGAKLAVVVADWPTADFLGEALVDWPEAFEAHAALLRQLASGRRVVVASARAGRAALAAGLDVVDLADLLPVAAESDVEGLPPCGSMHARPGRIACCGGKGRLEAHQPDVAHAMAASLALALDGQRSFVRDARCAERLRAAGADVRDPVTMLLGGSVGQIS